VRLALVTTSYPEYDEDPAGHFVGAEVSVLTREGHDVTVVAARGDAFGWPGVAARLRDGPWRALGVPRELVRLRERVVAARPERIIAHWAVPSGLIAHGLGPIELVSHGADVRLLRALPRPLRAATVRALCKSATAWRFVSNALLDDLLVVLPALEARAVERLARVRPCPIDLPSRASLAPIARQPGRALAVAVGRLVVDKRFDRVIDHVAATPATELVVIGDGPERARLVRHAETRGVDARFVGLVPRTEALAWIAAADVLLHASEAEGASTVLREAAALGTAVVLV
jgi:glycosyltransferase involved in cell wall biosynthesis